MSDEELAEEITFHRIQLMNYLSNKTSNPYVAVSVLFHLICEISLSNDHSEEDFTEILEGAKLFYLEMLNNHKSSKEKVKDD